MALHGIIDFSGINLTDAYVRVMTVDSRLGYADKDENGNYQKVMRIDYSYSIYVDMEHAQNNPIDPIKTVTRNVFHVKLNGQSIDPWRFAYEHLKQQTDFVNFVDIF
jgi:hypothetical protein